MSLTDKTDWPFTGSNMPDLSKLDSNKSLKFALNKMFLGGGAVNSIAATLSMNFVRLTDHLIFEYESCRIRLIESASESSEASLSPYMRAVCHMETAVTTMQRAIKLAQRIRNLPHAKRLPIPDRIAVLRHTVSDQIRDVRNAVEHVDNQIANSADRSAVLNCLVLKIDYLECEGRSIKYAEFSGWIQQLDPIAEALATYKEV